MVQNQRNLRRRQPHRRTDIITQLRAKSPVHISFRERSILLLHKKSPRYVSFRERSILQLHDEKHTYRGRLLFYKPPHEHDEQFHCDVDKPEQRYDKYHPPYEQ